MIKTIIHILKILVFWHVIIVITIRVIQLIKKNIKSILVKIERSILKSCWTVCKYKVQYFFNKNHLPEINDLISISRLLKAAEITEIVERKITSIGSYQTSFWPNFKVTGFYRARTHNHLKGNSKDGILYEFTNEGEFWNPPSEDAPIGRCNDVGESLLYCSTSWETAIIECRPKVGNYISVTSFNLKDKEKFPFVENGSRINPIGIQYLSQIVSLNENQMFANYDFQNRNSGFKKMDAFLDDLFHLKANDKYKFLYKLSIAVTRCMMKNIKMGEVLQQMHGIIYSSIERDKKNYNILFRPDHARMNFCVYEVQTFKVVEVNHSIIRLRLKRIGKTYGTKDYSFDNFIIVWQNLVVENQQEEEINLL